MAGGSRRKWRAIRLQSEDKKRRRQDCRRHTETDRECLRCRDEDVVDELVVAEGADAEEAELYGRSLVGGEIDRVLLPAGRAVVAVDRRSDAHPAGAGVDL